MSVALAPLNLALAASTSVSGPLSPSGPLRLASTGLFTVFGVAAWIAMIRVVEGGEAPGI